MKHAAEVAGHKAAHLAEEAVHKAEGVTHMHLSEGLHKAAHLASDAVHAVAASALPALAGTARDRRYCDSRCTELR